MSGNRTRGVCVTGRNVTNYTNTDLFLFQNLKRWIRSPMFEFQRARCCNRGNYSSFDHTMVDTPHPIRTAKLSTIGPNQYCGGGPRGNLGCRMFFSFPAPFFFFFGARHCTRRLQPSFDQTTMDIPHPIRTAKSSIVGPNQYCGGGPRGNLGCRMFFFFSLVKKKKEKCKRVRPIFFSPKSHPVFRPSRTHLPSKKKKKKTNRQTKAKSHAIVTTR